MNTRPLIQHTAFTLIILPVALVINFITPSGYLLKPFLILYTGFWIITLSSLILFLLGESKSEEAGPLYSLSAVGMKFILSAVLALIYFTLFEKSGLKHILLFFILYLAFTIYLILTILKRLTKKSLKKDQV